MTAEPELSVRQAATTLDVSPRRVRQLLEVGELRGRRVGPLWLVNARHLRDFRRHSRPRGRPLTPANAWKALALLSGHQLPRGTGSGRARLLRLVSGRTLTELSPIFMRRGVPIKLASHPGLIDHVSEDDAVTLSGGRASGEYGIGLVVLNSVEGYIRRGELQGLMRRFALEEAADGNVALRVVSDDVWVPPGKYAPLAAIALDLLETRDARSREAGALLARGIDTSNFAG